MLLYPAVVGAQFLPGEGPDSSFNKAAESANLVQNADMSRTAPVSAAQAAIIDKESQKSELSPFEYSKIDVEENKADNGEAMKILNKAGKKINDEVILIYMKDFNVYRTMSKQIRCAVRFAVISTYKEKISNVSYELKWPKMSTRLSFSDIMPKVEYYIDYLLLGDGCYTMDKVPNIIVNRCRVKGKEQAACAASVRWMKFGV